MAVDVNITGLSDTGTELGGFLGNMAPGLSNFLLVVGVAIAIVGLITAVIFLVKKVATKGFK